MAWSGTLDSRIWSLSVCVDKDLRDELQKLLRTLREADNPIGVLLGMSRLCLRLIGMILTGAGTARPSDNLYDCIVTAARGDETRRVRGLRLLPDEIASYFHTIRVLSNKADHDAEMINLDAIDAENALALFLRILDWYYREYEYGPRLATLWSSRSASSPADTANHLNGPPAAADGVQARERVVGLRFVDVTSNFKDRDEAIGQLRQFLADPAVKLVCIVGRGGMGKTALLCKLCEEVEYHLSATRGDGIVYISCQGSERPGLDRLFHDLSHILTAAAAAELKACWEDPSRLPLEKARHLLSHLRNGSYLLVLDNLEDILGPDRTLADVGFRAFVDLCLTTPHGLRIVATSRERLVIHPSGAKSLRTVFLESGLPTEDGVALLKELDPDSVLGLREAPREILVEATVRCLGVPRALETIAGILAADPSLTLADLLSDLKLFNEQVVDNLVSEHFLRVTDEHRRVLEALSVFQRPVPAAAVLFVLAQFSPAMPVVEQLRMLVRDHYVSYQRSTELYHLHPLDQMHIYSSIPVEGSDCTRRTYHLRAASYWAGMRRPRETWKTREDLEPVLQQFEQLVLSEEWVAACNIANELDASYLMNWGYWQTIVLLRSRLVGRLADHALAAHNLARLGAAYWRMGDSQRAVEMARAAADVLGGQNDPDVAYDTLNLLGVAHATMGMFDAGAHYYEQALQVVRGRRRKEEGNLLGNLGNIYADQGQPERAMEHFQAALAIMEEVNDADGYQYRLGNLAAAQIEAGEIELGLRTAQQALELARGLRDTRSIVRHLGTCGAGYLRLGELEVARCLFLEGLELAQKVGDQRGENHHQGELALLDLLERRTDVALDRCLAAMHVARRSGNRPREARHLCLLGRLRLIEDKPRPAMEALNQAAVLAESMGARVQLCQSKVLLAIATLLEGDRPRAQATLEQAAAVEAPCWTPRALFWLGAALLGEGRSEESRDFLERARSWLGQAVLRCRRNWEAWFALGCCNFVQGATQEAMEAIERARTICGTKGFLVEAQQQLVGLALLSGKTDTPELTSLRAMLESEA